jgi:FkbM family methyltransferase
MGHFDAALAGAEVVLDIGANIGIYSMRAASRLPASGTVIAVEPLPQNVQALCASVRYNGFRNVQVFPFAASDSSGMVVMVCDGDSSNGVVIAASDDGGASVLVPAHRLDTVLASLERLDVIKIDVEGHEPFAWQGLTGLLQRFKPVIFLEFSPVAMRGNAHTTPEDFAAQLLDYSPQIRVLHRDREPVSCSTPAAIMAEWEAANQRLGLGGEMHLDMLLTARP